MVLTVKNAVTAVMLMDVTTLLVTAAVWLDGLVRHFNIVHMAVYIYVCTAYQKYHSFHHFLLSVVLGSLHYKLLCE